MDFKEYETFLENLSSIMSGVSCLIQKATSKSGERFVWSPVAPDIVEEGALSYVGRGLVYTDIKTILRVILEYLDDENFIVELVYIDIHGESYYLLSIGH